MQPCGGSHDALDVTRTLGLDIPMGGSFMLRLRASAWKRGSQLRTTAQTAEKKRPQLQVVSTRVPGGRELAEAPAVAI